MPIKLMYITNQPEVAKIAEKAGVDVFLWILKLLESWNARDIWTR